MTLAEWRARKGLTLAECAKLFRAANGKVVWNWETGECVPRRSQMRQIWLATEGAVSPDSFYDLPALPGSQAAPADAVA